MERTLILLKPDCVQRRLVGRVLDRFETRGFRIVALKMIRMDRSLAERFYAAHQGRDFYEPLLAFMTSCPCVALVLEGPSAVRVVRTMVGTTASAEAAPGTIRGDLGLSARLNLIHASDAAESAAREIGLVFERAELLEYELSSSRWVVPSP